MRIYMIRHGETDWNKKSLLQGKVDTPLNAFGRKLAEETAEGMKEIPLAAAYTSPLKRAKETAQTVIGDRDIPIIDDERIEEIGFGEFEGLCLRGENRNIPDPEFDCFFKKPEDYHPPKGGESLLDVKARVSEFLEELCQNEEYREKSVLVSTHGCAFRAMMSVIKNEPLSRFWGTGVPKNCEVAIIDVTDGKPVITEEGRIYYESEAKDWYSMK